MILKEGNMWDALDEAHLFLITANATVRKDGELVMGRGMALQAKQRFPLLPKDLGDWVVPASGERFAKYGVVLPYWGGVEKQLGAFQVKYHYGDKADLDLIQYSTNFLIELLEEQKGRIRNVHLNFPGIGYGGLKEEQVLPIVQQLLDIVTIWKFPS